MSDIRLIMLGSTIIFAGFVVGGLTSSQYSQFALQAGQFDDCYDYSSGTAIKVRCDQKEGDKNLFLVLSIGLIGGGAVILAKGIRGKWDQNVKSDEMLGPKHG
ncbi:MAG: hypothetical protein E6K98_04935 [Thaumarchaeota archaeon]|nr:MAG: hypothetical protein E6K98_04935 [Nitrososphaerota archaeon]